MTTVANFQTIKRELTARASAPPDRASFALLSAYVYGNDGNKLEGVLVAPPGYSHVGAQTANGRLPEYRELSNGYQAVALRNDHTGEIVIVNAGTQGSLGISADWRMANYADGKASGTQLVSAVEFAEQVAARVRSDTVCPQRTVGIAQVAARTAYLSSAAAAGHARCAAITPL